MQYILRHRGSEVASPRMKGWSWVAAFAVALAILPGDLRYRLKCYAIFPILGNAGMVAQMQHQDGHYYLAPFVNPPEQIAIARKHGWGAEDLVLASYPKSGTHYAMLMTLLTLFRGDLPRETDLHSLVYSPEFRGNNARPLDEPKELYPTSPRLIVTHMPQHHMQYSPEARYVYVMRDPVATICSWRKFEQLMFGPFLTPSAEAFVSTGEMLLTREGGWLDNVLRWWRVRDRENVLLLNFEEMTDSPVQAVKKLAALIKIELSAAQEELIAERMTLQWSLLNVDPFLYKAITPFSPPDRHLATHSGFIVNSSAIPPSIRKVGAKDRLKLRQAVWSRMRALIEQDDTDAAHNAASFFESHRAYFCSDGVC